MTDMNSLTVPGSPFLLLAGDIDPEGHVVGEAFHPDTLEAPAYVTTPSHDDHDDDRSHAVRETPKGSLPENVRRQIEQRLGFASELIP